MATDYGKRLREARKGAGLTQKQLSQITGIAQSTISTAEREGYGSGDTPIYAKVCGVNALWLANGEGPKTVFYPTDIPPSGAPYRAEEQQPSYDYTSKKVIRLDQIPLNVLIRLLAGHLRDLDAITTRRVANILSELAFDPEGHASISYLLKNAIPKQEDVSLSWPEDKPKEFDGQQQMIDMHENLFDKR